MRFLVRDMEIPLAKLRSIVSSNPRVFLYSLDDNLIPKLVYFLIMTLHMDLAQVQKLLTSYPQFLSYSLDRHIVPLAQYLTNDLGFGTPEVRALALKYPRLFTFGLARVKTRAGYLRYELGLGADQVRRVLGRAPQAAIGLGETNLKAKVEFLRSALGFGPGERGAGGGSGGDDDSDDDGFRKVLAGMPTLLMLSVPNNLQPKVVYLVQSLGGRGGEAAGRAALRGAVLRHAALLGYSLEGRIRPRMERILRSGADPSSITVGIPLKEADFDAWLRNKDAKSRKASPAAPSDASSALGEGLSAAPPSAAGSVEGERDALSGGSAEGAGNDKAATVQGFSGVASNGIAHWTRERRPWKK
jgi:hypothetical protein